MLRGIKKKASLLSGTPSRPADQASAYKKVLKQVHDFEVALEAMDLLLDDRSAEGTRLLKTAQKSHSERSKEPAAIFPLALGVMEFIEATLGFEAEVMQKAHSTLSAAEDASLAHSKLNQKMSLATSHIYPPGTEFQVTYAESTLLNALVMLLQENNSMMEQMKALLKLRRAYQILDATYKRIKDSEGLFNHNLAKFRKQAMSSSASVSSVDLPGYSLPENGLPEDRQLMENMERIYQMRKKRVEGTNLGPHSSQVNLFRESTASLASVGQMKTSSERGSTNGNGAYGSPYGSVSGNEAFLKDGTSTEANALSTTVSNESDDFEDATDTFEALQIECSEQEKNLEVPKLSGSDFSRPSADFAESFLSNASSTSLASKDHLHVSTIDEFIHSGVQLCFGILQVVLSLIPPTIGKVLSIVGFKGNRDIGLRMLWRTAITCRNIHGELALLCLLVFYDGPIQFIDVGFQLPGHEDENVRQVLDLSARSTVTDNELSTIIANPNLYTPQLLAKARLFFPHNALWLLQEGRMLAAQGKICQALQTMQSFTDNEETHIGMEQVEALLTFDRALFYAFVHDYDSAARDFLHMIEINSWSQAVYMFMAGACFLEKWRMIEKGELTFSSEGEKEKVLAEAAHKAEKYLKLAPTYVPGHGANAKKKGGIGGSSKQMPFDKFVLRKTSHIEERVKANPNLSYIECVGTSLIHELIYFWNAYNRMPEHDLQVSMRMLDFSAQSKFGESNDEAMIRHFLQSIILRQLGKVKEGQQTLDEKVISKYVVSDGTSAPFKFTKMTFSPYLYPTALYERAMFSWIETKDGDAKLAVKESLRWLKKAETVADVGDYELSNRTSMKIKAATERLESLKPLA
ncbi:hypothetical protein FOB63_003412 [Clavispora lusitaniae]|uniref:Mitochondrial outer membrane protein n=1 Tax=Clavispora lusitaniae (strain ATCC 42720) TaxID=306902 RepID=C4Y872_CLAL4|nr:uncharacterized protein CLUG_04400 [Clavispora lusitaniae ATCC 42720]EEQ40272.1 hypothetical protein CLUG_04400 [Clavispora lusitaniae ATCC 42720]KAF5209756.1 Mitochondrial outer membrane protein iml2 [Clavispora lusitaniae]KAF7581789.1 hypothetical protein FOB63_003412 [Clavispora lusitaniae]